MGNWDDGLSCSFDLRRKGCREFEVVEVQHTTNHLNPIFSVTHGYYTSRFPHNYEISFSLVRRQDKARRRRSLDTVRLCHFSEVFISWRQAAHRAELNAIHNFEASPTK